MENAYAFTTSPYAHSDTGSLKWLSPHRGIYGMSLVADLALSDASRSEYHRCRARLLSAAS